MDCFPIPQVWPPQTKTEITPWTPIHMFEQPSAPNSGSPWSDAHKHMANLNSPPPCSHHPIHYSIMSLLWTANYFFPGFYFTPDLGRFSDSQPCSLDFGWDENLESVLWGTASPICRARPSGTNKEVERGIEVGAFAPGKCPQRSILLESHPSHQTCYQKLCCSSPPTWSTKTNPKQRTKQPTDQETNQSFTEISTSVCVLQAILLVHKKQFHP